MRRWKIVLFGFILIILLSTALGVYLYYNTQDNGECDPSLWEHVYSPDRLIVKQDCITVTGRIELIRQEADGDYHIRLKLDEEYSDLVNERNVESQNGDLVVEAICQEFVFYPDAVESCIGFDKKLKMPFVGAHVRITGSYVLDDTHGWTEIHPATSIKIIWIKTIKDLFKFL